MIPWKPKIRKDSIVHVYNDKAKHYHVTKDSYLYNLNGQACEVVELPILAPPSYCLVTVEQVVIVVPSREES